MHSANQNSTFSSDLGGLGPTTPAANPRMARKAQSRSAVAGPSKPASKTGGQRKNVTPISSGDERHPVLVPDDDTTNDNDGEESVTEVPLRKPQTARRGKKPNINGVPRVKGKGKAKAPSPKMTRPASPPEVLDDSDDDGAAQMAVVMNNAIESNSGGELKRLRRELTEVYYIFCIPYSIHRFFNRSGSARTSILNNWKSFSQSDIRSQSVY